MVNRLLHLSSNAVLFGSFAFAREHMTNSVFTAGAFGGAAMALVNCPVELLKVRVQSQGKQQVKSFSCCLVFRNLGLRHKDCREGGS